MKRPLILLCALSTAFAAEKISTPIENDQVKVLNVVVQPHEKTRLHQHKVNRVMVYLNAGQQTFEYADGKHSALTFKAGEVKWSPADGMHIAEVVSQNPVNIIEVELKKPESGHPAAGALDPVKVDRRDYKVILENDQVRVLRVKIAPHQSSPMHQHSLNRVVVYLTDQNFRVTGADGKVETSTHKAWEVSWGAAAKHSEQNMSDTPFEVVVIELKD
ncbi:MAG: hypothetical protein ABI165_12665 [Bryobacteraceae bacterium]